MDDTITVNTANPSTIVAKPITNEELREELRDELREMFKETMKAKVIHGKVAQTWDPTDGYANEDPENSTALKDSTETPHF